MLFFSFVCVSGVYSVASPDVGGCGALWGCVGGWGTGGWGGGGGGGGEGGGGGGGGGLEQLEAAPNRQNCCGYHAFFSLGLSLASLLWHPLRCGDLGAVAASAFTWRLVVRDLVQYQSWR